MGDSFKDRLGKVARTIVDIVFVMFCASFFMFFLFFGNLDELTFFEILPFILIFSSLGWVLYLVLRISLKKRKKAALISGAVTCILFNAGRLTEPLGYVAVLLLTIFSIAAVTVISVRFISEAASAKIVLFATIFVTALLLFNTVISLPQFSTNKRLSEQAKAKAAAQQEIKVPEKYVNGDIELPNFYIFIFDELAGAKCMQQVYNYDNAFFYENMRELGFAVSENSTNYKQFTMECLSGLFNLDYIFSYDADGYLACDQQFKNARFFSIMKKMGYTLYETEVSGFVDFEPRYRYYANKEYRTTEDGRTTLDLILDWSVFGRPVQELNIFSSTYEKYNEMFAHYMSPKSYAYRNAFTFAYVCCPHAPFIYDINGERVDDANRMNWSDPKYFLEQYEYMCGQITDIMQSVIQYDPESIIIVLSDHGVKQNKHLWDGPVTDYAQSVDTFFAVYAGGSDSLTDITNLCGADILRKVLNTQFGFNLSPVSPPEGLGQLLD